jgi:Na+/proline symporter
MSATLLWWVGIATAIPVTLSLFTGFRRESRASSEAEYLIAGQHVSANDYANTSVGYALQMAAVFLFADWGAHYGIGALWVALFWCLGFALLYWLLPKFMPFRDKTEPMTLHEYLAKSVGGSRRVQIVASLATILGLSGTLMNEVFYTLTVYEPVTGEGPLVRALAIVFLAVGMSYVVVNGFKAEVRAERVQMVIAYVGFIGVLVLSLPFVWSYATPTSYARVELGLIATLALLVVAKVNFTSRFRSWRETFPDSQVVIPIIAILIILLQRQWTQMIPHGHVQSVLEKPFDVQITAMGWLGVISLFVANALWMPVDLATWQRVESVDGRDGKGLQRLRKGTLRVLIESPASWSLGVVLGWILSAGGFVPISGDTSAALGSFANALATGSRTAQVPWANLFLYVPFLAACVAIMLSTISGLLTAVGYTAYRDLLGPRTRTLNRARIWTLGILAVTYVAYTAALNVPGATLATLLYGAYAMQLALIVSVLVVLAGGRGSARAAFASIAFGMVASIVCTALAIWTGAEALYVLPPVAAVLVAIAFYCVVYPFERGTRKTSVPPKALTAAV